MLIDTHCLLLHDFTNNLLKYLSNRTSKTSKMLSLQVFGFDHWVPTWEIWHWVPDVDFSTVFWPCLTFCESSYGIFTSCINRKKSKYEFPVPMLIKKTCNYWVQQQMRYCCHLLVACYAHHCLCFHRHCLPPPLPASATAAAGCQCHCHLFLLLALILKILQAIGHST